MKSINIDILGNALFYETAKPFLLESSAASIVQIATITAIEHHDVPITPSYGDESGCDSYDLSPCSDMGSRWD